MKRLTYKKVCDKINEAGLKLTGEKKFPICGSDYDILITGIIEAVNEALEPDTETGYEWQDPTVDTFAAIHQIQDLLDQKL